MKCEKCGEELLNGFRYCRVCGAPVSAEGGMLGGSGLMYLDDEELKGAEKFFIDPREQLVGVLGRDYLESYLAGKRLRRGFIAVTDRRVYQKGKAYVRNGTGISHLRTKGSTVIDLAEITGTRIFSSANLLRLVMFALLVIAAISVGVYAFADGAPDLYYYISGGLLLAAVMFLLGYLVSRRGLITITFKSGGISLDRKWFRKDEFYEFQRCVYIAKDVLIESRSNRTEV